MFHPGDTPDLSYHAKTRQRSSKMHKRLETCPGSGAVAWPSTPRISNPLTGVSWAPFRVFPPRTRQFCGRTFTLSIQATPHGPWLAAPCGKAPVYLDANRHLFVLPALAHPSRHKARLRCKRYLVAAGNPNRRGQLVTLPAVPRPRASSWRKNGHDLRFPKTPEPRACKKSVSKASTLHDRI